MSHVQYHQQREQENTSATNVSQLLEFTSDSPHCTEIAACGEARASKIYQELSQDVFNCGLYYNVPNHYNLK